MHSKVVIFRIIIQIILVKIKDVLKKDMTIVIKQIMIILLILMIY